MEMLGAPLFAVIEPEPVVWQVIGFVSGTWPVMVSVGRWYRPYEGSENVVYRPTWMLRGEPRVPVEGDKVIYAPNVQALVEVIEPWMTVVPDGE